MTVEESEFGKEWTAKWSEQYGSTQVSLEFREFDPTKGAPQYSGSILTTTDGKSYGFSETNNRAPGVARLDVAVLNPDNTGGGAWCLILAIE